MDLSLLPYVGALAAALVGYLIAARRAGGNIRTSEATDLWDESRSIREWSQGRIDALDRQVTRLEDRIDGLFRENGGLRAQVAELRHTVVVQEHTIQDLTYKLETAKARVAELERRNDDGH